ncbi:hypothetical protein Pelo_17773 [Pelomyxa schiedti]|nr:hypothetical protein Pelo_17773 [Pelomyxa schiedti]
MVLAVAVTSQRCGAHSPAAIMGGYILQQLWCDWVIGCSRLFVVRVLVAQNWNKKQVCCDVIVGVSVHLLGITQLWVRDHEKPEGWFGENNGTLFCDDEDDEGGLTHISSVCNGIPHWNEDVFCAKSKDWEIWKADEREDDTFTVVEVSSWTGVEVALPQDYLCYADIESITLSHVNPSRAVLLLKSTTEATTQHNLLAVVDVPQTYATGTLKVLSTTRCTFPPSTVELCRETAVAMKCTSGQIVFIVEKMYDDSKSEVAFSVQQSSSSGGLVHGLYNDLNIVNEKRWARMLWEVTESLFSVYNPVLSTVDVWDCNDLIGGATGAHWESPKPKTTIEHVSAAPIAGGGFIFHVTSDTLQVVEPSSGLVVAVITFALPGTRSHLARVSLRSTGTKPNQCESDDFPKKGITESALSNPQKSDNFWEFNGT